MLRFLFRKRRKKSLVFQYFAVRVSLENKYAEIKKPSSPYEKGTKAKLLRGTTLIFESSNTFAACNGAFRRRLLTIGSAAPLQRELLRNLSASMLPAHGTLSLSGEKRVLSFFFALFIFNISRPEYFFKGQKSAVLHCFAQDRKNRMRLDNSEKIRIGASLVGGQNRFNNFPVHRFTALLPMNFFVISLSGSCDNPAILFSHRYHCDT